MRTVYKYLKSVNQACKAQSSATLGKWEMLLSDSFAHGVLAHVTSQCCPRERSHGWLYVTVQDSSPKCTTSTSPALQDLILCLLQLRGLTEDPEPCLDIIYFSNFLKCPFLIAHHVQHRKRNWSNPRGKEVARMIF